jgi:DNA polymerase-1
MDRLMLLDANGLIYRGYFALINTPLTTSRGLLVNAVFGFWSIVLRGFQDVKPDYVICAFDLSGPTFRHEAFADYKATRQKMPDDLRDQFPRVRELVTAFRIPIYEMQGFEADDVIGTLSRQAEGRELHTTIVSGDLDMLQLVTDRTHVMTTRGGVQMTVTYDPAAVHERYGLVPAQMIDFKALKGDTTDNIPGVPGVGDKTASKLLQDFGTLDGVYERLEAVKPDSLRARLGEHREQVLSSRELVTIHRDLPIELRLDDAHVGDYDRDEVMRLFREYEFRSLIERLPAISGEQPREPGALLRAADAGGAVPAAIVPGRELVRRPAGMPGAPGGERDGSGLQLTLDFDALAAGRSDGGRRASEGAGAGHGVDTDPRRTGEGLPSSDGSRPAGESGTTGVAVAGGDASATEAAEEGHAAAGTRAAAEDEHAGAGPRSAAEDGQTGAVPEPRVDAPFPAAHAAVVVEGIDPGSALAAVLRDPGRIERLDADPASLATWLAAQPELAVGLVLDRPEPRRGRPVGLAVAGADCRVVSADDSLAAALLDAVVHSGRPIVGHETKQILVAHVDAMDPRAERSASDITLPRVAFDTQVAAYILNATLRSQPLVDIAFERLGVQLPPRSDLQPWHAAALEALAVAAVRGPLGDALASESLGRLYDELELPLIPVLAGIEATGVKIDREALNALGELFGREIGRLEAEIYVDVGHEFNLGSPKQLEQVLFYELNLPKGKRTKTGYSTDAATLEGLKAAHPMIDKLLDWRSYSKLKSTYVDALPGLIDADTGRLHTTFHQAVAATGRLSSSDPNLQNIPIRTELGRRIRRAFVAGDPSLTLLAADYSQIELRILAHVSGDEHLREAFARGEDIHRSTAARVLHKAPEDVTPSERSMAKMVNFGIAYGMSDFGLSSRAGIPQQEAREFITTYFATYSGISYYMLHIKDVARTQGFVTTLLGRRRFIPELQERNPNLRAAGERMAINMPIQGTAADIIKLAMIRVADRLRREGFRARMLLQVHDELLFEVPRDEVARLAPVVRETMESAMPLDVPLTVDLKSADDWESMTPLPDAPPGI